MKKKIIYLLVLAMACFALAACGGDAKDPAKDDSKDPVATEQTVRGTVTDATMNTLAIDGEDGVAYQFTTVDADVQVNEGDALLVGDLVEVNYLDEAAADGSYAATTVLVRETPAA